MGACDFNVRWSRIVYSLRDRFLLVCDSMVKIRRLTEEAILCSHFIELHKSVQREMAYFMQVIAPLFTVILKPYIRGKNAEMITALWKDQCKSDCQLYSVLSAKNRHI